MILRPFLGPPGTCCYFITCSEFARKKIDEESNGVYAAWLIFRRVLSCNRFLRRDYLDR